MTTVLESVEGDITSVTCDENILNNNNNHLNNVLKSKKRILKTKCDKALKKKLKKYRIRRDGHEDQDVIDVSQILQFSLKIKSPTNLNAYSQNFVNELEELRPKNYLFKMAKRKPKAVKNDIVMNSPDINMKNHNHVNEVSPLSDSQEKKHTNAFKLMMESRNKSIGNNSPGKEKINNGPEVQELIEKRNIKAKRTLVLQKMAESKGSLKKKEMEIYQEECIKRKMDKRAERLKNMISNVEKSDSCKVKIVNSIKNCAEVQDSITNQNNIKEPAHTLKLINLFKEQNPKSIVKEISKDDEEFLKKLSPSIRKKENMLSYFKKVEKDIEVVDEENVNIVENDSVIKVKLPNKKKVKKVKHNGLRKGNEHLESLTICSDDIYIKDSLNEINSETETRKRKRKIEKLIHQEFETVVTPIVKDNKDLRPKRCTKRPVKYMDDLLFTSSDEELHIFTPKKKKQADIKHGPNNNNIKNTDSEPVKLKKSTKSKIVKDEPPKEIGIQKKTTKLAPIFATKTQPDPSVIEAKQKFLQSGMPDKIKKMVLQKKNRTIDSITFPTVVHVQQITTIFVESTNNFNFFSPVIEHDNVSEANNVNSAFTFLTNLCEEDDCKSVPSIQKDAKAILHDIKKLYPKFPVYRTYHLLREKSKGLYKNCKYPELDNSVEVIDGVIDIDNDNPDKLNWTDKYKALSADQIIGNFDGIGELRKWLISWTENENKAKTNCLEDSDSSDFCYSDGDSKDSVKGSNNLLILSGPVGSGKTSSVYAVALELAIKVIEVNASTKRTGKIMLQDLQEATQSHKVNRGKGTENSQKSQEFEDSKQKKKRGRPKKHDKTKVLAEKTDTISDYGSQESVPTAMSLILIDDADIVFDQDDGFCAAIAQLVHSSKRPVILITASLTCSHLQRFISCGKIISLRPLMPRMLGTWLDILCLADNGLCWPGLGAKFLELFRGDIRKTMNCLQFYMPTHSQVSIGDEVTLQNSETIVDDENSSMSWVDNESFDNKHILPSSGNLDSSTWKYFVDKQIIGKSYKLFNIWWNIQSSLLSNLNTKYTDEANTSKSNEGLVKLDSISKFMDNISLIDYCYGIKPHNSYDITERPWSCFEGDSVTENENIDYFNIDHVINDEISQTLLKYSMVKAERDLNCQIPCDIDFPGMTLLNEKEKVLSLHNNLTSCFNQAAILDRKALALDYWSNCRTICRTEKNRTDFNSRRNNRFCHYLKSLNVLCKNDSYDKLADSLNSVNKTET